MKTPEKYYDEIFEFSGQWDMPSRCGLKIIDKKDGKTGKLVIVTELYQDNPGTSVTAAGKKLADQICRAKGLSLDDCLYLECNPDADSKLSFYDEVFFAVDFSAGPEPVYRQLGAEEARALLET
jgi:hypothetical protein